MSRSRRFFERNDDYAHRGPSDEMLAVDAATEMRSMTLLYERWADRLYRYFLVCTADSNDADRMMRELLTRLPEDLQRFAAQDRSFGGWLFSRASEIYWRDHSIPSRMYRRVSRYIPWREAGDPSQEASSGQGRPVLSGFDEMADALKGMTPDRREVLGIHLGAELKTAAAAEALRLPASLISSHVQWSLEALGEQLDVSNTRRLSEDLGELIGNQSLSSQQRQSHFSLMHGVFLGEVEAESDEPQKTPVFEIAALVGVVLIGLIGIWVWGLITEGDTREHEVATSPPVETASDPDPTPTPTVESEPTPDAEAMPDSPVDAETVEMTCLAAEGKSHFDRFIARFNEGDFESLAAMLPDEGYDHPLDNDEPENSFNRGWHFFHDGNSLDSRGALVQFLQERYEQGERWDVLEAYPAEHYRNWHGAAPLEMYQDWKREHPGLSMIIVAGMDVSSEDDPTEVAQGRVVVDCDERLVISWDLHSSTDQNPPLVGLDDYLAIMQPLENGEVRFIRALVHSDDRPDGGLLSTWELGWWTTILEDGTEAERIDITTLEGHPAISYIRNGDRWSLDQRGWMIYGGEEEPPFSDEIALPIPWLQELPEIIETNQDEIIQDAIVSLTGDFSFASTGRVERVLDVNVQDGNLISVSARERTPGGERERPRIEFLAAFRGEGYPGELQFQVASEPEFPQLITDAPRYEVPVDEHEHLEFVGVTPEQTQIYESYQIAWNGLEFDLRVAASRGGLDESSVATPLDDSWTTVTEEYRWGTFVWAHRHFAGYPTDALWDDGRYLFALAVDREANPPEYGWDLDQLIELVNVLSADLEFENNAASMFVTGGGVSLTRGPVYLASDRTR